MKAKFVQSPELARLLLGTNHTKLAEASYDRVWGTGVPLHDDDYLNVKKWYGTGIMGNILMQVCSELSNPRPSISEQTTEPMETLSCMEASKRITPSGNSTPCGNIRFSSTTYSIATTTNTTSGNTT